MKKQQLTDPMTCGGCGRVCNGIQGLRGHKRGCPGRKPKDLNQVREPEEPGINQVEPGKPLVDASNQQITLGSRLEIEGTQVVIRIYALVQAMREQLGDALPVRQFLDGYARSKKWPRFDDWFSLAKDVARIELATERILQQARVSRDEPWTLHQLAFTARTRWVSWRREEAYHAWKQQPEHKINEDHEPTGSELDDILTKFGVPELEAKWNQVIDGLRWLTAHTRATL